MVAMVAEKLRRLAAALRAGEFSGSVPGALVLLAAEVEADEETARRARKDTLATAALDAQRAGCDGMATGLIAASHMVS